MEVIFCQFCDNVGFDVIDIFNRFRVEYRRGNIWVGVDFVNEGIIDMMERFVWEFVLVKINVIQVVMEVVCLILGVDEMIRNEESVVFQVLGVVLCFGDVQRVFGGRGCGRGMFRW